VLIGFHIGSQRVEAQAPEDIGGYRVVGDTQYIWHIVMLPNGDVFQKQYSRGTHQWYESQYLGNFWDGVVTTDQSTWGGVKELKK
jgi:hypothetical protein